MSSKASKRDSKAIFYSYLKRFPYLQQLLPFFEPSITFVRVSHPRKVPSLLNTKGSAIIEERDGKRWNIVIIAYFAILNNGMVVNHLENDEEWIDLSSKKTYSIQSETLGSQIRKLGYYPDCIVRIEYAKLELQPKYCRVIIYPVDSNYMEVMLK